MHKSNLMTPFTLHVVTQTLRIDRYKYTCTLMFSTEYDTMYPSYCILEMMKIPCLCRVGQHSAASYTSLSLHTVPYVTSLRRYKGWINKCSSKLEMYSISSLDSSLLHHLPWPSGYTFDSMCADLQTLSCHIY